MIKKEFKCEMQSKIQSLTPVSAKYQVDYNKVNQIRFLYDYGNFTNDAPYSDVRLKNLSNVKVHMDNSNHLKVIDILKIRKR